MVRIIEVETLVHHVSNNFSWGYVIIDIHLLLLSVFWGEWLWVSNEMGVSHTELILGKWPIFELFY